ncbi:MAG: transketolase [Candidatus Lokiarchaeota archaeon]|nr:transketolase [Candidatus Lokiarchaeota archaeon]
MITNSNSGHPGGSLSITDVLVCVFNGMHFDPKNPMLKDRDRLILSKGHACPALYALLADYGYFSKDKLKTLRKLNSGLQGHPYKAKLPGIEFSSGSMGQGLSFAVGVALALKIDKIKSNVYVIIGDGESNEGQIWEAAMAAGNYKLDNIIAFTDRNFYQAEGKTEEIMKLEPLAQKWEAFNWYVKTIDGHNIDEIMKTLEEVKKLKGKPKMIIAKTIKGKGVSFLQGNEYRSIALSQEQLKKALEELDS